jgi:hypothetical protein
MKLSRFPYRIKFLQFGPDLPLFSEGYCRIGRRPVRCWRLMGHWYLIKLEWRLV